MIEFWISVFWMLRRLPIKLQTTYIIVYKHLQPILIRIVLVSIGCYNTILR